MKNETIRFLPCGDSALTLEFSKELNEAVNQKIRFLAEHLSTDPIEGITECVPAFVSLTIYYDPFRISFGRLKRKLTKIIRTYQEGVVKTKRTFRIPVCYEEEFGPDMKDVCELTGLSQEEVIALHTSTDYLIYMLGFLPGFPYLGGMDPRLSAPRLSTPRTEIPAGAVGIGGKQTGIYPLTSPGGWRLIGRTPIKVYDPHRQEPILYRAGDSIRFYPITAEEFRTISESDNRHIEMQEVTL